MIYHDDRTVLSDAQLAMVRHIEHSYGDGQDAGAKIEYGYCDHNDVIAQMPAEVLVVLTRGVKWDHEQIMWTMDVAGVLTIQ